MKNTTSNTLNPAEVFGLISRYKKLIITGTSVTLALFVAASFGMPKKYKSQFALTIYAKYFQNPLIRDFMPEVSDPGEMRSQRESLIRQSLTPEFIDSLGEKYGIYKLPAQRKVSAFSLHTLRLRLRDLAVRAGLVNAARGRSEKAIAREELLSRIQVFNMNATTFNVSFVYAEPDITLAVTRDIHAQVVRTLTQTHRNSLVNIRDAIRMRLESLTFNMSSSPDPRATERPQIVKEELAGVRNQIRALSTQFTDAHPAILELKNRERLLSSWQAGSPSESSTTSGQGNELMGSPSQDGMKDIYNDLTKKLNYLNIALEADRAQEGDYLATFQRPIYPEAPLWPKKGLMALWGLALGFVISLTIAALREYFERTSLRAVAISEELGVPLLGELPVVAWNRVFPLENRL